jgi:glycosyltransferase involved in cell wall biosynthesis
MGVNPPMVSVVIPAYNQAQYLAGAIRSVLTQSYRDFEVIVVDDGSTDDTPKVAKQFGPVVRYTYQENQGLAGSRNTGIREAKGEYIAFLDSDDEWSPEFLQKMTSLAVESPNADVYYCGARYMDAEGCDLPQDSNLSIVPPDKMYWTLLRANFIIPSSIILRRSVSIKAGLFDLLFRRLQDWEFWLRLAKTGHKFIGVKTCLVRYRLHNKSLSTDSKSGNLAAIALAEKHFGPDDGKWLTWSDDKRRMYGGVYRYQALMSSLLREGDWKSCADNMRRGLLIDPTLTTDLGLFYELSLGQQPLGYRGTNYNIDIGLSAAHVKELLDNIFEDSQYSELERLKRVAHGSAYYALGLVAYNLGLAQVSRIFLAKAIGHRKDLCLDRKATTTLFKTLINPTMRLKIKHLQKLLSHSQ